MKDIFTTFKGLTEPQLQSEITKASNRKRLTMADNSVEYSNLPISDLGINRTIGIRFSFDATFFIWTSQFVPHLEYRLTEITINNKIYDLTNMGNGEKHLDKEYSLRQDQHFMMEENKQVNFTTIGGFHECDDFNEPYKYGYYHQEKEIKVSGWKAHDLASGELIATNSEVITFYMPGDPTEEFYFATKLITHQSESLNKIKALTKYDEITEEYKHFIYFNTDIPLAKIYRIDIGYYLDETYEVDKGLITKEFGTTGFDVTRYEGLKEGEFIIDNKTFQYELELSIDGYWDYYKIYEEELYETELTQITEVNYFKIGHISVDYNAHTVLDDTFSGSPMGMFQDEISDVTTYIWKFGEVEEDPDDIPIVIDDDEDKKDNDTDKKENLLMNTIDKIGIIGSSVLGLILIYIIYKILKKGFKFLKK